VRAKIPFDCGSAALGVMMNRSKERLTSGLPFKRNSRFDSHQLEDKDLQIEATIIQGDGITFILPDSDAVRVMDVEPWSWEWVAMKVVGELIGFGADKVLEKYLFNSAQGSVDAAAELRKAAEEFKQMIKDAELDQAVLNAETSIRDSKRSFSIYQATQDQSWLLHALQSSSHGCELLVGVSQRNSLQPFGSLQIAVPVYLSIMQEYMIVKQDRALKSTIQTDLDYFSDTLQDQINLYTNWFTNEYTKAPWAGAGAPYDTCRDGWCWATCYPSGIENDCAPVGTSTQDAGGIQWTIGFGSQDLAETDRQNNLKLWLGQDEKFSTAKQVLAGWQKLNDLIPSWDMKRRAKTAAIKSEA